MKKSLAALLCVLVLTVVSTAPAIGAESEPDPDRIGFGFAFSGLLVGGLLGFVLQRGRFCMNTAFRDTIFIRDFTIFKAYVVALLVAIVGSHLLADLGVMNLYRQPFRPVAQIVGGYVFGMGIVLAGGCGSGIWYRAGEGQIAACVAIMGFFTGIVTTYDGVLSPVLNWMKGFKVPVAGEDAAGLWHIFGDGPMVKWVVIAVLVAGGFIFVRKDKPFSLGRQKGYYWSVTGLLVGLIAVLAFWASDYWGGFPRGISFTTPTRELFLTIFTSSAQAPGYFPMKWLGYVQTSWGVFFIVGVPLGAAISARGLKEFAWKSPSAKELLTVFGGSLMMGFGATAGGGCNFGQGITGAATLSIGSIVATVAMILGNWTMVYFKFIKPMGDMDLD